MIEISELTEGDIGTGVLYVPSHDEAEAEHGIITTWNRHCVFVRYDGDRGSKSTRPEDLERAVPYRNCVCWIHVRTETCRLCGRGPNIGGNV